MKQKIGTMKPPEEPVSDLDALFVAVYNLLYEKLETEPNKGIVVSKGNPNQRKVRWGDLMETAHMLEDFFAMRKQKYGQQECQLCSHWKSVSERSPHIGMCDLKNKSSHAFSTCRRFDHE